jgi:hypothetical protein
MDDVVLRHIAEPGPEASQVAVQVDPVEGHRSLVRRHDSRERIQQRRLARAAPADDREQLARPDLERDAPKDPLPARDGPAEVLRDDPDSRPRLGELRHQSRARLAA